MRGSAVVPGVVALALAAAVGCTGRPFTNPPEEYLSRSWRNDPPSADHALDSDVQTVGNLAHALGGGPPPAVAQGPPQKVLLLSGGGKYGAYTAGLLAGWTATGTRPEFDAVTGISGGALTAALAYGGPKYDDRLKDDYTRLKRSDLFKYRPVRGILWRSAMASADGLEDLIASELTPGLMADMQAAHAAGRRLYVGTANLTTHRLVVWDVGAIASSGRPDAALLVRKILLAACSIPGFVEPVRFDVTVNGVAYKELHGDAGNLTQAFVRTRTGLTPGSDVYVMSAGKAYPNTLTDDPRFFEFLTAAISNSLYALFRADMVKAWALCAATGSRFHMNTLPQDFQGKANSLAFDPDELTRMYALGYRVAEGGIPWRDTPPGTDPSEAIIPRTGFGFGVP